MLTFILLLALAETQAIPFDASRWTLVGHGATTMAYLERPSLFVDNGVALLRDSSFGDGTIEFDVALHGHASFAGVAFRALSEDDYELIYLRPHLSRRPDALQYSPIYNGAEAWQLYSGSGYTAEAELPLNRWLHVKLVVSGYTARLFVDNAANPQLTVTSLKRPWTRGMIGLWGSLGGANFSNVMVSPADTSAPTRPTEPPPAPYTLTKWELSPAFETTAVKDDALPDRATLPASAWTSVTADSSGLVNIAEYRPQNSNVRVEPGSRVCAFDHHRVGRGTEKARVRLQRSGAHLSERPAALRRRQCIPVARSVIPWSRRSRSGRDLRRPSSRTQRDCVGHIGEVRWLGVRCATGADPDRHHIRPSDRNTSRSIEDSRRAQKGRTGSQPGEGLWQSGHTVKMKAAVFLTDGSFTIQL